MSGTDPQAGAPDHRPENAGVPGGTPPSWQGGATPPPPPPGGASGPGHPTPPYGSAPTQQYPVSPQAPWGYPPAGPPPTSGGTNKTLWIILACVAAFVVLAVVAVIAIVVASGGDAAEGGTSAEAGTQSEVVEQYLGAVADGDAAKALSLAAVEPLEKSFLTDEVLAASAEIARITDIRVGEVANEYSSMVPATFKVGDQTVTEDFFVTKAGEGWKLRTAGSELDFTRMRANTLPPMINGQDLEVDKVTLFPGAYELSAGSDYISFGQTGRFTVKSNRDYLSSADLTPTLTPAGEKAYVAAVKASTKACLQRKELSPANCPNEAGGSQTYRIDKATIRWKQRGTDAFANLQPRLDYDNPAIATSRPNLQMEVTASCSSSSGRCNLTTYSSSEATVDMTTEPLTVKWTD